MTRHGLRASHTAGPGQMMLRAGLDTGLFASVFHSAVRDGFLLWPRQARRVSIHAAAAIAILLALTACGQTVFKPVLVTRDPPGPELTDCPAEPLADMPFADEAARYQWAASAIFAGRACRETLGRLKAWALNPPGRSSSP